MTMQIAPYAKMYAALIGSVCTALLGVYAADSPVGKILTIGSVIATAVATFTFENKPSVRRGEDGAIVVSPLITALIVVVLVLAILWLVGVHVDVSVR